MDHAERVVRERALRRAVRAGDASAWQAWYDECFAGLDAYVLWRCGHLRDHADEVVQDTWLIAVRRIAAFDPDRASFAVWLRGIAVGVLRNRFRLAARRQRLRPTPVEPVAPPADDAVQRREQAEQVARALCALPERYEAVLRARYLEGHSVADVAAATKETVKAVESLLTRARQAFRAAYLGIEEDA
jgi:RNA polymerase sigma-70 factor (ECF subfamily)